MKRQSVFLGVLIIAPFLATACVTPPRGIATIKGTEQEDIPIPKAFEFKESESPDLKGLPENARFRSWRGYYRGTGHVGDIAAWYVGEMRKHGWQFKTRNEQGERRQLSFEKPDEVSEIQVYRELDGVMGGYVTVVRAEIHPRGPEDLTFEEHLKQQSLKEPEIKPASFSTKDLPAADLPDEGTPKGTGEESKEKKAKKKKSTSEVPSISPKPVAPSQPYADTEVEGTSKEGPGPGVGSAEVSPAESSATKE